MKSKDAARNKRKIAIGVIVCVPIAIISIFLLLDWNSKTNYAKYDGEANRIISLLSKAEGVIRVQVPGGIASGSVDSRLGDGLENTWKNCGVDVSCPESRKSRLVLIPRDRETQFLNSLLQLSSYYQNLPARCSLLDNSFQYCSEIRKSSHFRIYFTVEPADPYHHGAPIQEEKTSPNVWRYVTISATP